jgi:hypothetical protein
LKPSPVPTTFPRPNSLAWSPFHVQTIVHCRLGGAPIFATRVTLYWMNQIKAFFFRSSHSRPMQITDLAPASTPQVTLTAPEKPPYLRGSSSFFRKHVAIILLISIGILIPCFWLPKIEAGDLPSHTYNAWLASLIQKGQAPGLWIAPQHNNVLADILLLKTGTVLGFAAAEKIVAALAVLLFFWGAFALATVSSGKLPWFLIPFLAMLAYGWTFHMGFLNFYFSLGISFVGLAILGQPNRRLYPIVLLLAPLMKLPPTIPFARHSEKSVCRDCAAECCPHDDWRLRRAKRRFAALADFPMRPRRS